LATVEDLDYQEQQIALLNNYRRSLDQLTIMQRNLVTISQPITSKIVPMSSGNLYQVAAEYYGDPYKFNIILDANNLKDVQIKSFINLIIPVVTNNTSP